MELQLTKRLSRTKSQVEDGTYGMFLLNNQNPTYVLANAIDLSASDASWRSGMVIMNIFSTPPLPYSRFVTLVSNNEMDSVYLGAAVWGRAFAVVDSNTVHLTDPGSAVFGNAGIAVVLNQNSQVTANTVIGSYNGDENRQRGISSWSSAGSVFSCNQMENLGKGFSMLYPPHSASMAQSVRLYLSSLNVRYVPTSTFPSNNFIPPKLAQAL